MFFRKFLAVLPILVLSFFNGSTQNEKSETTLLNITSKELKDDNILDSLAFIIRNSPAGKNFSLPPDPDNAYRGDYLKSLQHKKRENYSGMYNLLSAHINSLPGYYPIYDELVFAANASGNLDDLEKKIKSIKENSYSSYLKGCIESAKGNYTRAFELFADAYKTHPENRSILYQLADAKRNSGEYKEAFIYINKLLKEPQVKSKAELAAGALYFLSGDHKTSSGFYSKALETALKTGDRYNEAKSYINIGINKDVEGDIEAARASFNKAIVISHEIGANELTALAYSELGVSYSFTYDLSNARKNYLKSYSIYEKLGNRLRLALLSENLGKIYSQYHNYSAAVEYFENGIAFAGDNRRAVYLNKSGLAGVMSNLGNYSKSLQLYKECEKLASEMEDDYLTGDSFQNMGQLNYNLGRYENAVYYYNKSDDFYKKSENFWNTADIMHKKALAYLYLDSLQLSGKCFTTAVKSAEEVKDYYLLAVSLIGYSDLKVKEKKNTEAKPLLKKASLISVKNNFDNLNAEIDLLEGRIYKDEDKFFPSKEKFISALETSRSIKNYDLITECLYNLALLHEKYNLPELAESYYNSAIAEIENKARPLFDDQEVQISFYNTIGEIYKSCTEFYLHKQDYRKAFEIIDRSRSRNNIQNLGNIKLMSLIKNDSLIEALYEYDWMLQSGIYDSAAADSISFLYNHLINEIIESSPESEFYLRGGRFYSLSEIQDNLTSDENLILIYPAENTSYIIRISNKEFEVKTENISRSEISRITSMISPVYQKKEIFNFLNQDLFAFNASASAELYSKLLRNTISGIPANNDLIFINTSEISFLPFEFLVTEFSDKESAYNYQDKNFLINDYNISYAPSVSVYINQKKNRSVNEEKYLVVGNPFISNNSDISADMRSLFNIDTMSVLPLKYSAEEINEIGSILKTNRILTEKNATETNFRSSAENSRIIHISTHSFLMNKQPVIFFSNTNDLRNDGLLETAEIIQMKLNSDLVVLSSCNSGIGRIDETEGIIGMTKAFFEAGTKSVVVSLWEVNDRYTSAFMTLFYNHLSNGLTKTESLRQAKLDFIKDYSPNPYYWSAFILAGNTDPVNLNAETGLASFIIPSIIFLAAISLFVYYLRRKRHRVFNNPL